MEALLYFLLWGGLFFVLMRFGCGSHVTGHQHGKSEQAGDKQPNQADGAASGRTPDKPAEATHVHH